MSLFTQLPSLGAIKTGDIYIPHRSIERTLAGYSKQIFIQTEHPIAPYSLRGSSAAIRYKNRLFAIACSHQYRDVNIQSVSIPFISDTTVFITPSSIHFSKPSNHSDIEDFEDINFLEFPQHAYDLANMESNFLDLTNSINWHPKLDAHLTAFGYPSELQDMTFGEEGLRDIKTTTVSTGAKYIGPSSSPHLHRISLLRNGNYDTDGMSGSPLFFITGSPRTYEAGLAGIITRGSKSSEYMHFVDWSFIKIALERITS